jgi:two-component system, NtrC family, response regulator AtoC
MHVLVIDDEAALRQILSGLVSRAGYSVDIAASVAEATSKLARGEVDVALCDVRLPDGDGIQLVRAFKTNYPKVDTQFIMVTAFASMETAVEALRAGATDYIVKPVHNEELLHRLAQIDAMRGLKAENQALRNLVAGRRGLYQFISPAMQQVDRLISKVAVTNSTVLITGESGTGKGISARSIHEQSPRCDAPFVAVNCSAIPENLIESEFFGHTKGAFTGADRARKGLFSQADRGTIFLDEIGELPLHLQTKLLHVIEDKQIRPLGGETTHNVDVRIIAATNRDLEAMVKEGKFREDLYFRLSMFHIHLPPLRERREDIAGLIRHLMFSMGMAASKDALHIEPVALGALEMYSWPGNVRQLENVISRAHILADEQIGIGLLDLPLEISHLSGVATNHLMAAESGNLKEKLRQAEARFIQQALADARGDRKLAAQKLGVGLSSLYRKLEESADLLDGVA